MSLESIQSQIMSMLPWNKLSQELEKMMPKAKELLLHSVTQRLGKTMGIIVCVLSARFVALKLYYRLRGYPNGPIGVPGLGCLPYLAGNPKQFLTELGVKYGDIVLVPLAQQQNVYINDVNLAKRLFKQKEFANHFNNHNKFRPILGFDLRNGEEWKKRRQHISNVLFSITKSTFILKHTAEGIDSYFNHLKSSGKGNGMNIREFAGYLGFNNVFAATFGLSVEYNDPFILDYVQASFEKFKSLELVMLMDFSFKRPLPEKLMWGMLSDHRMNEEMLDKVLVGWMTKNGYTVDVQSNKIEYNGSINSNDNNSSFKDSTFIGSLLDRLEKKEMTVEEILSDLSVIFSAAIDTMSNVTEYGFVLLAKYPKVQEMVYNELVTVLSESNDNSGDDNSEKGKELSFNYNALSKLNVFKAFIHELLRISCVAATGVPHQIHSDMKIEHNGKEYVLPKNALIHYNTFFIQKKQMWDNTGNGNKRGTLLGQEMGKELENDEIHLEYWLNPNKNNKFEMNNNFILFGTGLRDCVGQAFAKKEIYAIFGMLMLKYKFIAPNNDPDSIQIEQAWGFVQSIKNNIDIAFEPRI